MQAHSIATFFSQSAAGLPVMAFLAKRLPVPLAPEQPTVASMRDDVIDHRGRRQAVLSQASGTERMLSEE
jgi:hypothetical protein